MNELVRDAAEAVRDVGDGATIMVSGFGLCRSASAAAQSVVSSPSGSSSRQLRALSPLTACSPGGSAELNPRTAHGPIGALALLPPTGGIDHPASAHRRGMIG